MIERRLPSPREIGGFVNRHKVKVVAGGVAAGGIAVAPFVGGETDKFIATAGALSFSYLGLKGMRVFTKGRSNQDRNQ